VQTFERPGGDFNLARDVAKVRQKDRATQVPTKGRPGQNSEDRGYQTPYKRKKDDLERTNSRCNIEIPEKGKGKGNKQCPFTAPSNEDAKE